MDGDGARHRLRVSVLDTRANPVDWPPFLGVGDVDLVHADTLEGVLGAASDLAVVFASAGEASRVAAEFARRKDAAPLTLFVEGSDGTQPQTRLIEALVRGKREWEGTFDAMEDPLLILGQDGVVARANLALARGVNRAISDTPSRHYMDVIGQPDPKLGDPIADSLEDGSPRTQEAAFALLPKRRLVTTCLLQGGEGKPRQLIVVLKDLTALEDRRSRLLQAAHLESVGRLAGGVAHEINTPLASIALRTERLLKTAQDPGLSGIPGFRDFPRHLQAIEADVLRCKNIIAALLEFSRSRPPEIRETDLNALAERALELVGYQMKVKGVELELRIQPGLPKICADEGRLHQAIVGLLMNALDAVAAGGHVVLETGREDRERVRLTVADDGAGIPPEDQDRIFSPFFTTKPVGSGTGLGLALCHGVVASHGGQIRVESAVGQGTRITLQLPVAGA